MSPRPAHSPSAVAVGRTREGPLYLEKRSISGPIGTCRLCGQYGELTFEHTPPRAAYNDSEVLLYALEDWERGYGTEYLPEGRGQHVLCGPCNHTTGGAYGAAFAAWSRQGLERLHQTAGRRSLIYHGTIQPLRVIKQIVTIFFATGPAEFRTKHPYLEKFVRDLHQIGLPEEYRIYAFWYGGGSLRQSGVVGVMNVYRGGALNILMEFVHPPFGYVLSLQGELADRRPELISDFAKYGSDEAVEIHRRLPVLETHWMMPGDYRTQKQIEDDALVNDLGAAGIPPDVARALIGEFERRG